MKPRTIQDILSTLTEDKDKFPVHMVQLRDNNNKEYGQIKIFPTVYKEPIIHRSNNLPTFVIYGNLMLQITNYARFLRYTGLITESFETLCDSQTSRGGKCNKRLVPYAYMMRDKKINFMLGCPKCDGKTVVCYDQVISL